MLSSSESTDSIVGPDGSVRLNDLLSIACSKYSSAPASSTISFPSVSPILRPDVPNHIILNAGTFNPPHRGHLEQMLIARSSFFTAVAAIIIPSTTKWMQKKASAWKSDELILPGSIRQQLWTDVEDLGDNRVYVWKSDDEEHAFLSMLYKTAKDFGLDIRLSYVIGPDKLGSRRKYYFEGLAATIYTDWGGREFDKDWFHENNRPKKVKGHGEWLPVDAKCMQSMDEEALDTSVDMHVEDKVWRAWRIGEKECVSFLVPRKDKPKEYSEASSTAIRQVIGLWKDDGYNAASRHWRKIQEIALSPETLAKYLRKPTPDDREGGSGSSDMTAKASKTSYQKKTNQQ